MKTTLGAVALAALAMVGSTVSVSASETGLAGMHEWRRVGKKTCFVDHYHTGNGSAATRVLAERAAIASWTDFTALEYGSSWGNYRNAVGKQSNCTGTAGNWQCTVNAIACRGR